MSQTIKQKFEQYNESNNKIAKTELLIDARIIELLNNFELVFNISCGYYKHNNYTFSKYRFYSERCVKCLGFEKLIFEVNGVYCEISDCRLCLPETFFTNAILAEQLVGYNKKYWENCNSKFENFLNKNKDFVDDKYKSVIEHVDNLNKIKEANFVKYNTNVELSNSNLLSTELLQEYNNLKDITEFQLSEFEGLLNELGYKSIFYTRKYLDIDSNSKIRILGSNIKNKHICIKMSACGVAMYLKIPFDIIDCSDIVFEEHLNSQFEKYKLKTKINNNLDLNNKLDNYTFCYSEYNTFIEQYVRNLESNFVL